jgi:hypothetical protein
MKRTFATLFPRELRNFFALIFAVAVTSYGLGLLGRSFHLYR